MKQLRSETAPLNAAFAGSRPPLRVLAVLSPGELDEFFPAMLREELRGMPGHFEIADTDTLKRADLAQVLAEHQPDVVLAGWSTPPLPLELPPALKYVCYLTGSVKGAVNRRHLENGLLVTNWGGSIARTVAEAALMFLLMAHRRAGKWNTAMHREAAWADWQEKTYSLFGRRVGLHGFGQVGRELARLLTPFQVEVSAYDPHVPAAVFAEFGVRAVDELPAIFSDCDAVVAVAALVPETLGIITEDLLRRLPPNGAFVNVSRGRIVDEPGLVRVAREGRLQIGLDVYHQEPLPAMHPLRGLDNVVLLPHLAGPTSDRRCDAGAHALANIRRFAAGQPLSGIITLESYDRAT